MYIYQAGINNSSGVLFSLLYLGAIDTITYNISSGQHLRSA